MDRLSDDIIKYILMKINYNKKLFFVSKKINFIVKSILLNHNDLNSWIIPQKLNLYIIECGKDYNKLLKEYKLSNRIIAYRFNNDNNIELLSGFKESYEYSISQNFKLILDTKIKSNLYSINKFKWRLGNWKIYDCYCKNPNLWKLNNFILTDCYSNFSTCCISDNYNDKSLFNYKNTQIINLNNIKINDMSVCLPKYIN